MLRFIHAVGLLKLAVLVPVHACTHKIILVFVCGTYVPTLAYLWYLVLKKNFRARSCDGGPVVKKGGLILAIRVS